MQYLHNLRVLKQARQNLNEVAAVTKRCRGFGDLCNQLNRSALSVVSNIAEGAGFGSHKQFARFLRMARASNNEVYQQLEVLTVLGQLNDNELLENITYVGKMISCLIKSLSG